MFDKIKILTVLILVGFCGFGQLQAETWQVGADEWEKVGGEAGGEFQLRVAELKKLVNKGDVKAVKKAIGKLREDYPEIAGEDFEAYIKAELLLAKNKVVKAVHAYEKFLEEYPRSGLYEAALEREYEIAADFLAGRKKSVLKIFKIKGYAEGEKIMERVMERAGQSPLAARAGITLARSFEKRQEYAKAYSKWSEIHDMWSTGRIGRKSLLGMARTKELSYNGPAYNASCLVSARSFYGDFESRYPERAKELQISEKIEEITEELAYKHYKTGKYYARTGSRQAANLYFRMVVEQWGDTKAGKLAKEKLN